MSAGKGTSEVGYLDGGEGAYDSGSFTPSLIHPDRFCICIDVDVDIATTSYHTSMSASERRFGGFFDF